MLVNGSSKEQVQIRKGLKQGGILAPILFLLVEDGFGVLMKGLFPLTILGDSGSLNPSG